MMQIIEFFYRLSVCYVAMAGIFILLAGIIWLLMKFKVVDRFTDRMIFKLLDKIGEREYN